MNPEIKAAWLNALRSGKYSRGRKFLRDTNDNFCCLGVLCDIHPDVKWKQADDFCYYADYRGERNPCLLSAAFAESIGIPPENRGDSDAVSVYIPGHTSLVALNDTDANFRQIADIIEEHL